MMICKRELVIKTMMIEGVGSILEGDIYMRIDYRVCEATHVTGIPLNKVKVGSLTRFPVPTF